MRSCDRARATGPVPLEDEYLIPAFCGIGSQVLALGSYAGARKFFLAQVVAHRTVFPRLHVKFLEDETGNKNILALPSPITAYVHAGEVKPLD